MRKDQHGTDLKETSVRSSPRLRTLSAQPNDSLPDERLEAVCTSPERNLYPGRSTKQSGTPDRSITQRELKKLEDYWTKNNPVEENSPRLRCNRRSKFVAEECLHTSKRRRDQETPCTSSGSPSPGRVRKQIPDSVAKNITSTNTTFKPKQIDFDNDAPKQRLTERESNLENKSIANSIKTIDYTSTCKVLPSVDSVSLVKSPSALQSSPFSEGSLVRIQTKDTDSDAASEEYIPPRKKLRSEVTEDELWEGFPLTVSFKRLAPLCKYDDQIYENNQPDNIAKQQSYESGRSCEVETYPDMKTNNKDNHESLMNSSLDSTMLCKHTCLHESHYTEKEFKEELREDLTVSTNNNTINESKECTPDLSNYITIKKKKSEQSKTPVKRSLRLQGKSVHTPRKIQALQSETREIPKQTTTPLKALIHTSPEAETKNRIAASQHLCNPINATLATDDMEASGNDFVPVTDYEEEVNEKQYLVNKSISEILSCGSFSSLSDMPKKTSVYTPIRDSSESINIRLKENEFLVKTKEYISIAETKTVDIQNNKLIDDPKSSCSIAKSSDNEICCVKDRDIVKEKRRSSRIATFDKHLDEDGSEFPLIHTDEIFQNVSSTSKEETLGNDYTESETNKQGQDSRKNKNKKRKHCQSKHVGKSVPPLKIKLKFPLQDLPNKLSTMSESLPSEQPILDLKNSKAKQKVSDKNMKNKNKQHNTKKRAHDSNVTTKKKKQTGTSAEKDLKLTKVKKKKSARSNEDNSDWAVATNVQLRLDNDRRLSSVRSLLSNKMLDKHACVLWSSENRRHVQLSHAHASPRKVDEILCRKWETLPEREKIRYFHRARDALRDENRHSKRKIKDTEQSPTSSSCKDSHSPSLVKFLTLDPKKQNEELKKRLHFYREVSPEEYNAVMHAYKESYFQLPELHYQSTKSKQKKSKRKFAGVKTSEKSDNSQLYRKLLFEKVCESWDKVLRIWREKKEMQSRILNDKYKKLIYRLIRNEPVEFCKHTESKQLTETLQDLKELEAEGKLAVSGYDYASQDNKYGCTLQSLKEEAAPITEQQLMEALGLDLTSIDGFDLIQEEIPEESLAEMVEEIIEDMSDQSPNPCTAGVSNTSPQPTWEPTWQNTSPTKFLNEMAVDYILAPNHINEYTSAVSLLSKNVVYNQPLQNTQNNDESRYMHLKAKKTSTPIDMNNNSVYNLNIFNDANTGSTANHQKLDCTSVTYSTNICNNVRSSANVPQSTKVKDSIASSHSGRCSTNNPNSVSCSTIDYTSVTYSTNICNNSGRSGSLNSSPSICKSANLPTNSCNSIKTVHTSGMKIKQSMDGGNNIGSFF